MRVRTHLAIAGRHTRDSTPGSRGWLRTARPFCFPPPEGVSRPTPTRRKFCTLHYNGADVTAQSPGKLSPPPQKARSPGVAGALAVAVSGEKVLLGGGRRGLQVPDLLVTWESRDVT